MKHDIITCKKNPKPILSLAFNPAIQCSCCGQLVKIPGYLHTIGMLFGILCFILGAVFSIKYRSWVPYLPALTLIAISQWWLGWHAPRKVAS